jgi:MFS superfamily sulfate permease-like transporter
LTLSITTFVIGLPLSVWFLARICAVIDEPHRLKPSVFLVACLCALLLLLLLTQRSLIYPLGYAFVTVCLMHLLAFWLTTKISIGMPIYQQTPPAAPLLDTSDTETEAGDQDRKEEF